MYDTYVRESNSFPASREKKKVVKLSSIVNGVVSFFLSKDFYIDGYKNRGKGIFNKFLSNSFLTRDGNDSIIFKNPIPVYQEEESPRQFINSITRYLSAERERDLLETEIHKVEISEKPY